MGTDGNDIGVQNPRRSANELIGDRGIIVGSFASDAVRWGDVHFAVRHGIIQKYWIGTFQTNVSVFAPQDAPTIADQPVVFSGCFVGSVSV